MSTHADDGVAVALSAKGLERTDSSRILRAWRAAHDQAVAALQRQDFPLAVEQFRRAAFLRPADAATHWRLGHAYLRAGRHEMARACFMRSRSLDPDFSPASASLGEMVAPAPLREDYQAGERIKPRRCALEYDIESVACGPITIRYEAREVQSGRRVVMKSYRACHAWNDDIRERYHEAARLWLALERHANLVHAIMALEIGGQTHLVLERAEGTPLDHILRQDGPLPPAAALRYALQVCDGLRYMHDMGVVHRDLCPAHCLVMSDGTLKLTTSTRAVAVGATPLARLDLDSLAPAERAYQAPEERRPDEALDGRCDIFALGLLLLEMVTGQRPPTRDDYSRDIRAQARAAHVPEAVLRIILQCLPIWAGKRYPDCAALRRDLSAAYRAASGGPAPRPPEPIALQPLEWADRGTGFRALRCHDDLMRCAERGLALDSNVAQLWKVKGLAYEELRQYPQAIECYQRGMSLDPTDAVMSRNLGVVYASMGRYNEEMLSYLEAYHKDPTDKCLWWCVGANLMDTSRPLEALWALERATEGEMEATIQWLRASILTGLGRYEEALVCAEEGLRLNPRSAQVWRERRRALEALGRHEEEELCAMREREVAGHGVAT